MSATITNLSFAYDAHQALNQINLTVLPGECLVLCGISGCGKTTLTRLLNGLIPELFEGELTGEIDVLGLDTKEAPIYELATQVGSVFQNPKTQFFTVDVLSELAFACENQGMAQADIVHRIQAVAQLFEITHLLEREMFDLSGGEKQLVAFASAYMIQPKLLVLDEVSSNLDFAAIEKIKHILSKVKAHGCTLVIAEHRLYYLQGLADRYVLVEDGQIATSYSAADFNQLPPLTREKLGLRTPQLENLTPTLPVLVLPKQRDQLVLANISVTYRKQSQPALALATTSFQSGNAVGIVGHNGAGKTTLAKALTGLLPFKEGSISLNGNTLTTKLRVKQSFLVMQDVNYQLFCETVAKELRLKAGKLELFDEVVRNLNLEELLQRHPLSLSGGQKQRVAIASAILSGKSVIVLDEPTSGLDYYHMKQVSQAIAYLRQLNIFVFIISHDLEFIALTCNEVLTLKAGEKTGHYDLEAAATPSLLELMTSSD